MAFAQDNSIIDKAKQLLIAKEHITENQAHRLILKRAMNLRISKTECANEIIEKYNQTLELEEPTRKRTKTFAQGDNSPFGSVFFNGTEARI